MENDILGKIKELKEQGLTEKEIAQKLEIATTRLRHTKWLAMNSDNNLRCKTARELKADGYSNVEISGILGLKESQIRDLLK